jgi:predicted Zn finger-like uncharacterized protein
MIVICTKCQAKFRVPDEKVGPRGARVRCSRCQTIFVVEAPQPAAAPPARAGRGGDIDLEPATGGRAGRSDLPVPAPSGEPARPPMRPPASAVALAPPFPASLAADDPFAAAAAAQAGATRDPFAAPAPDPFSAPSPDPFAAADPFAAPSAAPRSTLPVTDLSDLLGAQGGGGRPAAIPPPLPRPAAPAHPAPGPSDAARPPQDAVDLAPPAPEQGAPRAAEPPPVDGGLALEERRTPAPRKLAAAAPPAPDVDADVAAFADPFAAGPGQPFDPAAFEFTGGLHGGDLALAGDASTASDLPPPELAPAAAEGAPRAPAAGPSAPAPAPAEARAPAPETRIPGQRASRVHAVLVNAVALAALLLVALAMLVVWRSEGPLEAASLRPAALLRILRGGASAEGPFVATQVRSGAYERARGAPLLFVSGRAVSRAAAPVAALAVSVEVVRGDEVIARGDAIAGAVPTPEELHGVADAAALAQVAAAARERAPARVSPGDAVPFLVAIADAPGDLDGAGLRVTVSPHPDASAAR